MKATASLLKRIIQIFFPLGRMALCFVTIQQRRRLTKLILHYVMAKTLVRSCLKMTLSFVPILVASARQSRNGVGSMRVRRVPIRSCVVCRQTSEKKTLLRVVRAPEKDGGGVAVDPTGRANGRGAYICASLDCIEKAAKQKRFERSLSAPVPAALTDELTALALKETGQNTGANAL
jgi:predicted RNA-binding protein YlxR (DUF448 family)